MNQKVHVHVRIGSVAAVAKGAAVAIHKSFKIPQDIQNDRKKLTKYLEKKADAMIKKVLRNGVGEKKFQPDGDYGEGCCTITHYPPCRITEIQAIYPCQ